MNRYEFAKEILGINILPAHQIVCDIIEHLNNKYGVNNWTLDFGRRGNPVVIINK